MLVNLSTDILWRKHHTSKEYSFTTILNGTEYFYVNFNEQPEFSIDFNRSKCNSLVGDSKFKIAKFSLSILAKSVASHRSLLKGITSPAYFYPINYVSGAYYSRHSSEHFVTIIPTLHMLTQKLRDS